MTAALRHALAYAAAGWPVFPTRPDNAECPGGERCECKAPFPGTRGFLDATTDPDLIRSWWRRQPDANVAIRTGHPGPDVLDVDVKAEGSGYTELARLKHAGITGHAQAIVMTRSRGLHCYFTGSAQPCGRLPRHWLDFKASGGYVLAPPSRVHGQPYVLLDYRAYEGCLDWQAAKRLLDPSPGVPRQPSLIGREDTARLADWVSRLQEGNRNNGLYWAARQALTNGLDPRSLLDAAIASGLSELEARRTIASARRAAA